MRVFGISRDSPWSHRAWAEALALDFRLLSDWSGDATRAFDVAAESAGMTDVSHRAIFLVGDGAVRRAWSYARPGEVPDVDELLAAV